MSIVLIICLQYDVLSMYIKKKYRTYILLNIITPLLFGITIYVFFRNDNLLFYKWLESIGNYNFTFPVSVDLTQTSMAVQIPEWVKFSLSDGIWIYVFTSTLFAIWIQRINVFWLSLPLLLGIVLEIAQLYKYVPGTFDSIDLIFLAIGYVLALISGFKWRGKCIEQ